MVEVMINMKSLRHLVVALLCNSLIFLPIASVRAADSLTLPSGDLIAPIIKHTPITTKLLVGEKPTVKATVTDNVGVQRVTVFYRHIGSDNFQRKQMAPEIGSTSYSTTLPKATVPGIEYYIQAVDKAGNSILHGHTFSPLVVGVTTKAPAQSQSSLAATSGQPEEKRGISKWVWIGVGVLALGAAAASGGGGGSSGGEPPPAGLDEPSTGTITLSAPTP